MQEFLEFLTGGMAVGLAFVGPPLLLLILIQHEIRKENKKNEKNFIR